MASDRQLSRNFWLREFPGWQHYTEPEVLALQETVQRVLQPVRDTFGSTVPTSGIFWSSGERRTGAHGVSGGTVDFIVPGVELLEVFDWGRTMLFPAGYLGRWIYEPDFRNDDGELIQREHLHAATRSDMRAAFGKNDIGAFIEEEPDRYVRAAGDAWGAYGDPIQLPGLDVVVTRTYYSYAILLTVLSLAITSRSSSRGR